jgi:FKBP-type peptidyl-prolyl cis-trans isomerase FklB
MIRSVVLLLLLSVISALASAGTSAEGLAFLAAKEKEEGVVKLPSGLLWVPWSRLYGIHYGLFSLINVISRLHQTYFKINCSYKELKPGTGKSPSISSPCKCHYAGSLIDGTEFDSSYKRGEPLTLAPNQVIKGWTEAMQLMKEGAKWELYIPSELGYGDHGAGGLIPGGAALVFTMELLEVTG